MGDESVTTAGDPATAVDKPGRVWGDLMFLHQRDGRWWFARVDHLPNSGEPAPDFTAEGHGCQLFSFDFELIDGVRPGQLFRFEFSADGRQVFYLDRKKGGRRSRHRADYAGVWKNGADCARWRAVESAERADRDAEATMEKDSRRRPDLEGLDPIREAYRRLPAPARAQLIAQVVSYIVRGGTKS